MVLRTATILGGKAGGNLNDLLPRDVDIAQHLGNLGVAHRHRLVRRLDIDRVIGDKLVDEIEFCPGTPSISTTLPLSILMPGTGSLGLPMAMRPTSGHSTTKPSWLTGRAANASKRFDFFIFPSLPDG
jgi:hypothetical protein